MLTGPILAMWHYLPSWSCSDCSCPTSVFWETSWWILSPLSWDPPLTGIWYPTSFVAQPLADQLFINQSEVMENKFYTSLKLEMLNYANMGTASRCLGTVISIWIHSATTIPQQPCFSHCWWSESVILLHETWWEILRKNSYCVPCWR